MTITTTSTGLVTKPASLDLTRDYDWRDDAACSLVEDDAKDIFFPVGSNALARAQEAAAKRICGICTVRQECLDWAVETGQTMGVLGGLGEDERRAVTGDRSGQYARCIDAQDWIEQQIAAGAKYRHIAEELGVGHHAVCRAVKFFRAEREGLEAAQDEGAAA
jgi:hypothetical protein